MAKSSIILAIIILISGMLTGFFWKKKSAPTPKQPTTTIPTTFYDITINDINNTPLDLSTFKNNIILIVNVASKCGFTRQYKGLQSLYETYKDQGLIILGVPSNDFGNQEPGSSDTIKSFCSLNYGVTFPLTEKVHVKRNNQHPLYSFLTNANTNYAGSVKWNFTKFLINHNGELIDRFSSSTKPESTKIITAITNAIKAKNAKNLN